MQVVVISIVVELERSLKTWKKTEEIGNQRKSQYHQDHRIVKIGLNNHNRPGDLKRLTVTQIRVKVHQLMLVCKVLKEWNNNNNNNNNNTVAYHPSRKLSELDEPDMRNTAGEVGTSS